MSIVHDVTRNVKKNRIFKIRYLIEAVEGVCDILDSSLCLALKEENSNISNEAFRIIIIRKLDLKFLIAFCVSSCLIAPRPVLTQEYSKVSHAKSLEITMYPITVN